MATKEEKAVLFHSGGSHVYGSNGTVTFPSGGGEGDIMGTAGDLSVSFHDVSYCVRQGVFKKKDKLILNNLS